jgi:hypothetical protein
MKLHFAGVIAKCETQQRPISKPSPKVSFLIRLAVFLARGRAYMKSCKAGRRILAYRMTIYD